MNAIRLVWELARKDLLLFAADRRGMLLCFGVPILLASVFGAIFHRPEGEQFRPRLFVVPGDGSSLSSRIVQGLRATDQVEATSGDEVVARRWLASESSGVAVYLPAGLDRLSLTPGSKEVRPVIQLHHAPGAHLESRWAEGIVTEVVL